MPTIERIGPDEWERARAIRVRALDDSADAFFVTAEQESASTPAEWRQRLERLDAVTFIASVDGADVGLVVGSSHHQHEGTPACMPCGSLRRPAAPGSRRR